MARRTHGDGSIYAYKDKLGKVIGYRGSIELGYGPGGKRKRKTVTGKTRRAVSDTLAQLRQQQRAGHDVGTKRQTVKQFLELWLRDVAAPRVRPTTLQTAINPKHSIMPGRTPAMNRSAIEVCETSA